MNFIDELRLSYLIQKLEEIFVKKGDLLDSVYPIGSIYMTTSTVSPEITLGGTWVRWGDGRTIVGVDELQEEFDTVEKTGGESEVTLIADNLPAHNHNSRSLTGWVGNVGYQSSSTALSCNGIFSIRYSNEATGVGSTSKNDGYDGFHMNLTHTHTSVGNDESHNNLQPYQTCYIWKRVEDNSTNLE